MTDMSQMGDKDIPVMVPVTLGQAWMIHKAACMMVRKYETGRSHHTKHYKLWKTLRDHLRRCIDSAIECYISDLPKPTLPQGTWGPPGNLQAKPGARA